MRSNFRNMGYMSTMHLLGGKSGPPFCMFSVYCGHIRGAALNIKGYIEIHNSGGLHIHTVPDHIVYRVISQMQ